MSELDYNGVIDVALIRLFVAGVANAVIHCPTNKSICDKYIFLSNCKFIFSKASCIGIQIVAFKIVLCYIPGAQHYSILTPSFSLSLQLSSLTITPNLYFLYPHPLPSALG